MPARMYRIPASKVVQVGKCSFVQDNGVLTVALVSSLTNNYIFSEKGAGIQPLALIGYWHEVINFIAAKPDCAIENRIADLPDIYMGVSMYRPGERFKGLFPIEDTIQQLVENASNLVPGNDITDLGSVIGSIADAIKNKFHRKKGKTTMSNTRVVVTFTYIDSGTDPLVLVGTKKVLFKDLQPQMVNLNP